MYGNRSYLCIWFELQNRYRAAFWTMRKDASRSKAKKRQWGWRSSVWCEIHVEAVRNLEDWSRSVPLVMFILGQMRMMCWCRHCRTMIYYYWYSNLRAKLCCESCDILVGLGVWSSERNCAVNLRAKRRCDVHKKRLTTWPSYISWSGGGRRCTAC